jgi:hypothetical protein
MLDPDRTGNDPVDETAAGHRDRQQTDDDERDPATDPPDPPPTDPPDLPDTWVPA